MRLSPLATRRIDAGRRRRREKRGLILAGTLAGLAGMVRSAIELPASRRAVCLFYERQRHATGRGARAKGVSPRPGG